MKEKSVSHYRLVNSGIDNKNTRFTEENKNITLLTLENYEYTELYPNDIVQFRKQTDGFFERFCCSQMQRRDPAVCFCI